MIQITLRLPHVYECRRGPIRVRIRRRQTQGERQVKLFPYYRTGIFLFVLVMAAVSVASARPQSKPPAASPASATAAFPKAIGSPNAPITMEIFGDFECPACRAFFEATVKQVIDQYVIPGKVYLVHRDFPLDMHPYARQAARLANAAAHFGQFEAVERALYDNQDKWSEKGNIDEIIGPSLPAGQLKKFNDYEAQHLSEINASIERDRSMRHVAERQSDAHGFHHGSRQDRSSSGRRRRL